jgi:hypothetical protein
MAQTQPPYEAPPGKRWVYTKYYTNKYTGRRIYPKNASCFVFLVNDK